VVGGGFRITPFARFDDGLLDVCSCREQSFFGVLWKLPLVMLGRHTGLRDVRSFRATEVRIRSRSGPLHAQFDGELRSRGETMDVTIEPGALTVLIAE
jgi:diacylglycerol kinase (ATP)